jgi:ABC-type polysaccharide/polyol phosphate transport system ATPase subunit
MGLIQPPPIQATHPAVFRQHNQTFIKNICSTHLWFFYGNLKKKVLNTDTKKNTKYFPTTAEIIH